MQWLSAASASRFIGRGVRPQGRRGLTLAECVLALVILSLAVTAIAYAVTAGQMQSAEAMRQSRATMLAEALMEEVLSKPYGAPYSGAQPARTSFATAGQYNVFSETAGNLRDGVGGLYASEFQRFGRTATVATGTISLSGLGTSTSGLVITVTVSDAGGAVNTLTRFMVNPS